MCGIVGYIGAKKAAPILLDGLTKLEYRGYDSAGIAVYDGSTIRVEKSVGRLAALKEKIENDMPKGCLGIGHTRWATHGRPSDRNAHPHTDCSGDFVVVHNGIIENYLAIKEELIEQGHAFKSETDTEVVAHLLESVYHGDFEAAVREVLQRIEGSYSLVFMSKKHDDRLICTKKDNPLVIGLGEGENFVASDIPAIIQRTRRTFIMNDGEIAIVRKDSVTVMNRQGEPVEKKVFEVKWNAEAAEKGGYEHFMLKEMYEQPKTVRDTLAPRVKDGQVEIEELGMTEEEIKAVERVHIVACGSAYHTGVTGKYVIEGMARIPVEVDLASEFRYRDPLLNEHDLVIVISQSGETMDSLAALREAKERGIMTLGIVNVVGSSIAREADKVMYTWAGPEIAVATTKAYSAQLIALYLLAMKFAEVRGTVTKEEIDGMIRDLKRLPAQIELLLNNKERIQKFANRYVAAREIFFIGRGIDYAIAMEGSLKLKEISYIHSEAYAAGELKHGTISLIEDGTLVAAIATQDGLFKKTLSNMVEVKTRGAFVLAVTNEGNTEIEKAADYVIYIPQTNPYFADSLAIVPLQLFAYYVSVGKGCDVDKPRNLAKSVTVE